MKNQEIVMRLRAECAKRSGMACKTEEQFEFKELLNDAANALEATRPEVVASEPPDVALLIEEYDDALLATCDENLSRRGAKEAEAAFEGVRRKLVAALTARSPPATFPKEEQ